MVVEHEHKTEINKDSTCTTDPDVNKTDVENSQTVITQSQENTLKLPPLVSVLTLEITF